MGEEPTTVVVQRYLKELAARVFPRSWSCPRSWLWRVPILSDGRPRKANVDLS
jgi:hypothetical protein